MGFLSPLFLAGLLAVAVPIALHLFRRRADPVMPFSAVRFLRRAPVEQARRRRLRDLVLLALRVAALALLALSFARPYLAAPAASGTSPLTVIALDTSYSVSTAAQTARAAALARAAVDDVPAGGAVALVRFDERSDVAVAPTVDRGLVRAAIDETRAGAGGTRYGAALAAATDLAGGRGARLVVVSDLQARGWAERAAAALPAGIDLQVRDVGAARGRPGSRRRRTDGRRDYRAHPQRLARPPLDDGRGLDRRPRDRATGAERRTGPCGAGHDVAAAA